MFDDLKRRVKKIGQPPGTLHYIGESKTVDCDITVFNYAEDFFQEFQGKELAQCLSPELKPGVTWIQTIGLNNSQILDELGKRYQLHPLTLEDILNVEQRPKVEEFPSYYYVTLKIIHWDNQHLELSMEQISIVFGAGFVISLQEQPTPIFDLLLQRLRNVTKQNIRQQGSDYLAYRLIDTIVDYYFVALEAIGDQLEKTEELIIENPSTGHARHLQHLKRQMLLLRKAIWPMREAISHLLRDEDHRISAFTHVYLRDLYDHIVQAIDTLEIFREMISSMLDIYLSSATNRMNEVMKVLTIIATIFIPITFLASLYGMNFTYMPELHWHWGYPVVLGVMLGVVVVMLYYFKKKKWL